MKSTACKASLTVFVDYEGDCVQPANQQQQQPQPAESKMIEQDPKYLEFFCLSSQAKNWFLLFSVSMPKVLSYGPNSHYWLDLSFLYALFIQWSKFFVELGWGVDEGSTWCFDGIGLDLGWQCCRWLCVVAAFLRVCSTDSWFHSPFGSCSVNVGYLVAPWWSILDDYSVDLRFITLVVWWYFSMVW